MKYGYDGRNEEEGQLGEDAPKGNRLKLILSEIRGLKKSKLDVCDHVQGSGTSAELDAGKDKLAEN